jgi:hypothetical protein
MYKPANSPVFPNAAYDEQQRAAGSDARMNQAKQWAAKGRIDLFNTLVSPSQVAQQFGIGTAINVAKLQAQTDAARASGLVVPLPSEDFYGRSPQSIEQVILNAPQVVPLSYSASFACGSDGVPPDFAQAASVTEAGYSPLPGMPRRAPVIMAGPNGPMHYNGAAATIPGSYVLGHPPVDSGVMGWIADHPWLFLGLAGAGVYAMSRRAR